MRLLFLKCKKTAEVTLFEPDKIMGLTFGIHVLGDKVVINSSADNTFLQVFDKYTGKYIRSLGYKGNGPGEFLFHVLSFDLMLDTLYLSGNNNGSPMFIYKPEDFLNGDRMLQSLPIKGCRSYIQIHPLPNGYLSIPAEPGVRFALHDKSGEMFHTNHYFPSLGVQLDTLILWQQFQRRTSIAVNPNHKKFAATYFLGAVLEIYSLENNRIELENEVKMYPPRLVLKKGGRESEIHPDCVFGLWGIHATHQYIYSVFCGVKKRDYTQLIADYIYVFDWEGNPVMSYTVPCKLKYFEVDESSNRIYIITTNEEGIDVFGYFTL